MYPSLFFPAIKFAIEKKKFEGLKVRRRPLIMGFMRSLSLNLFGSFDIIFLVGLMRVRHKISPF